MAESNERYVPFSQRSGLTPIPPQLALGEVSKELRLLIDYAIHLEVERQEIFGYDHSYFDGGWKRVSQDLHVLFFNLNASLYENNARKVRQSLEKIAATARIEVLFDLVEFLVRHSGCSKEFKHDIKNSFITARAAYRVVDQKIIAIGTEKQAEAFEVAIEKTSTIGASAARQHLVNSGAELRNGNWPSSVRESIHAVEAIARKIAPNERTLGPALSLLERQGHIHGSLKSAFKQLYGYTNDESGIRHALLDDEARVDETDALFMLGVCASFVSYLISKDMDQSSKQTD